MPVNPIHSADVRENAYMVWAYETERNQAETSRKVDIPLRTVQYWKRTDEWDKRYAEETGAIAGFAFEAAVNELQLGVSTVTQQIIKDATDSTLDHSERIASQRMFLSLFNPEQSGPSILQLIDARSAHLHASLPEGPANPRIEATRILEANILDAVGEQTKTRRKG